MSVRGAVLVHLASGIGNIILATPLLAVLARNGFIVDLLLDADYSGVGELFNGWDVVRDVFSTPSAAPARNVYDQIIAAIPPFYWLRFARRYTGVAVVRPPDSLFYENERAYYLEFARALGCDVSDAPCYLLPTQHAPRTTTVVLAPGSKPAEMAAKRWPFFGALAMAFDDVSVVGTNDDRTRFDGRSMDLPPHARSLLGGLSLRETASLLAGAAAVVANDCGLGHLAGALGAPTILLFGPTPYRTLGLLPPNVKVLSSNLPCQPCWFDARFRACARRIDCLQELEVETVARAVKAVMRPGSAVGV